MSDLDAFRDTLTVPEHRELFDYWRARRPEGRLPARATLDPVDIPHLLPWLVVFEAVWTDDRPRFRFRLVGTGCVERYGRDATGLWFEEVYEGETLARQRADYAEVAVSGEPSASRPRFPVSDKDYVIYDRLLLPFADDGVNVDALAALMIFG